MHTLNKPIGILGGVFDPVHLGHIEIAKAVYQQCDLSEIRFIPSKQALLKANAHATAEDRLAMLELACGPYPHFVIDQREIKRDTPSYMVETLTSLRDEFTNTPLCLILGMDALVGLPKWYQWEKIISLAHLIIINRPHCPPSNTQPLALFYQQHAIENISQLKEKIAGGILTLNLPPLSYASRLIRQQISQGENVETSLPKDVYQYIKKHQLYKKL